MQATKLWNKLLAQSPKGSILMGGAVVDSLWSKTPKDYDIFYSYKPAAALDWEVPENWKLTEADYNNPEWVAQHQAEYAQGIDENGHNPISSVLEYLVDDEHLVQLVGVNYDKPVKHFKNFDHSFTLGWYNKTGLFIHKEVFRAQQSHTVRYVSKNKDPNAVSKSLDRAIAKVNKYEPWEFWDFEGFDIPLAAEVPVQQAVAGVEFPF
jgi:hypothetical protein